MKYLLLLLILLPAAHALQWSEVLFNPVGNDNGLEYVELLGTESLQGCTIRDSASADALLLHHYGLPSDEVIMIVENGSAWLNTPATTYVVGSAIGNGLGNSFEILNVSCGNGTLITSYNISLIPEYREGESIIFDGGWKAGPVNGTPGEKNPTPAVIASNITFEIPAGNGAKIVCNSSLSITMSATAGVVGEPLRFTILSEAFTTYEATADNRTIATGDTLETKEHTIYLPNASSMKLVAYATACGRRQRATRIVGIEQPVPEEHIEEANITTQKLSETVLPAPTVTKVVVDDRNTVPWIAGFGSVTIVVSAVVFLHLLRREGRDN